MKMSQMFKISMFFALSLSLVLSHDFSDFVEFNETICDSLPQFDDHLRQQLNNISSDAKKIIDFVVNGNDRGVTYRELAQFVDQFGPRLTGTENLEKAIDYMVGLLNKEGHDKVYTEEMSVPNWTRGREWAEMLSPRIKSMNILGLGYSVGTNGRVLTADVVVVQSFDELRQRADEVKGKFVVFDFKFENYGKHIEYRVFGPIIAAKYGAVGALIRSITPYSIDSPHTGALSYNDSSVPKIPGVSITVEDADLISRLVERGQTVTISLFMEANNGENTTSRNTISEVLGSEHPYQVVIVSGHIDSWDVGQGAMDDGGGVFISWRALSVIKKLGLQPKRTMRSILWTGEEFGVIGSKAYLQRHMNELDKISIALEADAGTYSPLGLTYSGTNPTAQCILNEVLKWLKPINASKLILTEAGSDIRVMSGKGVPISTLFNENERYFDSHHTNGDTMTIIDSHVMDLCTAVWAVTSYAFASIDIMLPR